MKAVKTINRAKIIILTLFLVISAGMTTYHFMYVAPARKCEQQGRWWAGRWRACVTPVSVSAITGRPNPTPPPAAAQPAPAPKP